MKKKLIGITIFGDSIIKYQKNKIIYNWSSKVAKKLKKKTNIRLKFKVKSVVGINSNGLLKIITKILDKNFVNDIALIQIGINDSWHYKSLKGKACVPIKDFKKNLIKIKSKCKNFGYKKIIFLNYHRLLNSRREINGKTLNENLRKYNLEIKSFCKKHKVDLIDIQKLTKKIKNICLPLPDGIHLNNKGTKIYSNLITNFLLKILNEKKL